MSKKRDQHKVIYDILVAIKDKNGKIKPTHILYKSNLSHQMMQEYLDYLIANKFIVHNNSQHGSTYSLTQKGFDYINKYSVITDFMKTFGLNESD
jgi:predicted transcriptional regulator